MIYELNGFLRLGKKHELFKKGNITKKADGTFDVQIAIVLTKDGKVPGEPITWHELKTSESGVKIGSSEGINMPMCSKNAKLKGEAGAKPLDSFKLKVNLSLEGWVKVIVNFLPSLSMEYLFTGQDASDFIDGKLNLKDIKVFYNVPEEKVEPIIEDDNYEVEPEIVYPEKKGLYAKLMKINTFLNKNKWYFFLGFFIAGYIARWIL